MTASPSRSSTCTGTLTERAGKRFHDELDVVLPEARVEREGYQPPGRRIGERQRHGAALRERAQAVDGRVVDARLYARLCKARAHAVAIHVRVDDDREQVMGSLVRMRTIREDRPRLLDRGEQPAIGGHRVAAPLVGGV